MYIHRVITRGVPGLADQDLTFYNTWSDEPLQSVLLIGPNGSGKTKLLRVITALWRRLAHWLTYPNLSKYDLPPVLSECQFVAIELRELLEQPVWIFEFGRFLPTDKGRELIQQLGLQGFVIGGTGGNLITIEETKTLEFGQLSDAASLLQLGNPSLRSNAISNVVFIMADNRRIVPYPKDANNKIEPEPLYQWLTSYPPIIDKKKQSLEVMLRNLKVRDPDWYKDTLAQINHFLIQNEKEILDFGKNLNLFVQARGQESPLGTHHIEELSSGEQQVMILIFIVSRWLMPGGVVLIDEPDLHLHLSWQSAMIHTLKQAVAAKRGQLIITSHAPRSWDEFSALNTFNLNPLLAPEQSVEND